MSVPCTDPTHIRRPGKGHVKTYCHTCKVSSQRRRYYLMMEKAFALLGDRCTCCGETTKEFLTFDHIDGKAVRFEHAWLTARRIINHPDPKQEFRVLCMNCNHSLGVRGYCPHRPYARWPWDTHVLHTMGRRH